MHLRANEIEGEAKADGSARQQEDDRSDLRGSSAADIRAVTAVGAGSVTSLDAAGAQSLQRMAGNAAVATALQRRESGGDEIDGSSVHSTISGGGRPLDAPLQQSMSAAFGTDLSGVKIHDDSSAQQSAHAVQAKAYTVGNSVVLGAGVDTSSDEGKRTLAHELTHVVQQSAGPVDGTPQAGGVSVSDPSDRFEQEAEANADRVVSGGNAEVASAGVSASGVQRQELQRLEVQRQGEAPGQEEEAEEEKADLQPQRLQREEEEVEEQGEGE